ncbi:hypothetical protein HPP06_16320 [Corallococcus exiguus]|nr:hypothetical protein [Corallococcus exiguus]NRD45614.1 hypothetical protein [Corallococcus exiguus]
MGEKRVAGPPHMLFMGFWSVCRPLAESDSNIHAGIVVQHGRPSVGQVSSQLAHKLSAHQAHNSMTALCFGHQPAEHLRSGNVVFAKLLGQLNQ